MNPSNFLDLWDIFVNELVGSVWIFIFISLAIIIYLGAKLKFSTEVTLLLSALFLMIVFAKTYMVILWVFILLGIGSLFYYIYQKKIR